MVNSVWVKGEGDTRLTIVFTQAKPDFHFSLYSLQLELAKVEIMRQSYRKFAYAGRFVG